MPSLLTAIGAIGKGIATGAEAGAIRRARELEEARQKRDLSDRDREDREREALRRRLAGVFDENRRIQSDDDAEGLRSAGEGLEGVEVPGIAGIGLPFAAAGLKGAADKVQEEGRTPTAFDVDTPFETLIQIQERQQNNRARLGEQRQNRRRLEGEARSRNAERDEKIIDRERARGDAAIQRAALRRKAEKGEISFRPEEIDAFSDIAIQDLAVTSARGELGTRDANARATTRAGLRDSGGSGGGGGGGSNGLDGLTISDLNSVVVQQRQATNDLWKQVPAEVSEALGSRLGEAPRQVRTDVLASQIPVKLLRRPDIEAWFVELRRAEVSADQAAQARDRLLRGGVRRTTPTGAAQSRPAPTGRDAGTPPPAGGAAVPDPTPVAVQSPELKARRAARAREILADPQSTDEEIAVATQFLRENGT